MDTITNALLLRDEARPAHIALTYGVAGLIIGTIFLSGK